MVFYYIMIILDDYIRIILDSDTLATAALDV